MNNIKEIWLPLADRFYRVAFHLLGSQEDAEDAVQELYLKLVKAPDIFAKAQDPAAFGITILGRAAGIYGPAGTWPRQDGQREGPPQEPDTGNRQSPSKAGGSPEDEDFGGSGI